LYLDRLPENFLKLVSVEGFSGSHSSLTKFIKTDVLFQATVLKSFPEKNKAIIGIANKKIMVETQQPLKPGEVLLLRGDKTTSVPKLKIITDAKSINLNLLKIQDKTQISSVNNYDLVAQESISSKIVEASDIKDLLPFKEPFGKMIKNLKSLIDSPVFETFIKSDSLLIKRLVKTLNLLSPLIKPGVSPQPQKIFNSKNLKEQIEFSGINYESKVKHIFEGKVPFQIPSKLNMDLKYQLLDLLNTIEPSIQESGNNFEQRRPLMDIIKQLRHAVDNIELHQLTNQLARQENQPIVIQVPDPINFDKTIKVYIKPTEDSEENSKQEKEGFLLVFFLNMSALGNLRVDAQVFKESVSIKIKVENINVAKFIDSKLAEFSSSLKVLGSKVHATCCVIPVIKDDIASELNQLLIDDDKRLVDLTT